MRLIILLLVVVVVFLALGYLWLWLISCKKFEAHILRGTKPGPRVLLVAGTHGNEPAGSFALHMLVKELKGALKRGMVIIVPEVNPCGLRIGTRWDPSELFADLNRCYPHGSAVNTKVARLAEDSDWIVDLHEAWGYYRLQPRSLGSGLYPSTPASRTAAQQMQDAINATIKEVHKKFVVRDIPQIRGTLRSYLSQIGKNYILMETTGQNNVQPLQTRVDQCAVAVRRLLSYLAML